MRNRSPSPITSIHVAGFRYLMELHFFVMLQNKPHLPRHKRTSSPTSITSKQRKPSGVSARAEIPGLRTAVSVLRAKPAHLGSQKRVTLLIEACAIRYLVQADLKSPLCTSSFVTNRCKETARPRRLLVLYTKDIWV